MSNTFNDKIFIMYNTGYNEITPFIMTSDYYKNMSLIIQSEKIVFNSIGNIHKIKGHKQPNENIGIENLETYNENYDKLLYNFCFSSIRQFIDKKYIYLEINTKKINIDPNIYLLTLSPTLISSISTDCPGFIYTEEDSNKLIDLLYEYKKVLELFDIYQNEYLYDTTDKFELILKIIFYNFFLILDILFSF